MKTIHEAVVNHRSARVFRIRRGTRVLFEGDRNEVPEILMTETIKDSTYHIADESGEPKWEFVI